MTNPISPAPQYIPRRGDFVQLDLSPHSGHEQAGRRPALVISKQAFNKNCFAVVCPVPNQAKGYPFEVPLPDGSPVTGVVLADQIKSLDWNARNAKFVGLTNTESLIEVIAKARTLLS